MRLISFAGALVVSVVLIGHVAAAPRGSDTRARSGEYGARIVEDTNANGVRDAADAPARQTAATLLPWSDPSPQSEITLITAEDGNFLFKSLPPGDYSLRLYWPSGFVAPPSSPELPHILRAAFHVDADGTIGVPSYTPETWPGLPAEPFDVAEDRTVMGALPVEIVVNKDPGGVILSPGVASTHGGVGEVDVGALLAGRQPTLPSTGARADDGFTSYWLPAVALLALVALGVATTVVRRQRR
jgi:hypothetical protein